MLRGAVCPSSCFVVLFLGAVCLRGRGSCPGLGVLEAGVPYMVRGADAHDLGGAGSWGKGVRIGGIGSCPELGGLDVEVC